MKTKEKHKIVVIDWKPNKNLDKPIYLQIVEYVCNKISNGHWLIGSYLPSQRELSKLFEVNRSTIVSAMDELVSLGVIESSFGGGTKIISNTWSLLISKENLDWNKYVKSGLFKSNNSTIQTITKLEFKNYIRLGTGELSPNLFPHHMMNKIFNKLSTKTYSLNYTEPLGLIDLRIAISNRLKKLGINANPSSILITSGSLQALQLISISMIKKGSTVFTEDPSYLKSLEVFQSAGINLSGIPMDNEGIKYWDINNSLKTIDRNLYNCLLYTIPSFQNPTGTTMTIKRRKELFEFCKNHQLPVIEDCAYRELWIDEEPPLPLKSMDVNGMVLYVGTISKTLAPGLRIGWIIGPESIIERLGDVKMQLDYGASSLSQLVLTEFFESGLYDEHLTYLRKELKIRRDNAIESLNEYFKDLGTWNIPSGGFYIWLTLKNNISIDKLFKEALKEHILLNIGSIYSFKTNHSLRISYAYEDCLTFRKAVCKLSKIVKSIS